MTYCDYIDRRAFANKYDVAFRRLAGELSFAPAPMFADIARATDMVPIPGRSVFAHRVRSWMPKHRRRDFSIRYSCANGAKTEYAKIIDGRVPYMLYAWAMRDGSTRDFALWWCIDLSVFRRWAAACLRAGLPVPTGSEIREVPGGNRALFVCPTNAVLDGFDGLLVAVGGAEHHAADAPMNDKGGGPCQLDLF